MVPLVPALLHLHKSYLQASGGKRSFKTVREKIDASSFALILKGVLLFVFLVNRNRGALFPEPLGIFRFRLAPAGSASP